MALNLVDRNVSVSEPDGDVPQYNQVDNGSMLDTLVSSDVYNFETDNERDHFKSAQIHLNEYSGEVRDDERGTSVLLKDKRLIDYVLVWQTSSSGDSQLETDRAKARRAFENNLKNEGLELENDEQGDRVFEEMDIKDMKGDPVQNKGSKRRYTRIHAPFDVLCRYAEVMKIKMPLKQCPSDIETKSLWERVTAGCLKCCLRPFELDPIKVPEVPRKSMRTFENSKQYLFNIPDHKDDFFPRGIRSLIVNYILRRQKYTEDVGRLTQYKFGVNRLIADGTYIAAYPLHEGRPKASCRMSMRKLLWEHWANWRSCFKMQPLHYIRVYFGEKIAFYFAWLGYYIFWLIPASIIGLAVFAYGLLTIKLDIIGQESCDPANNFTMCPMCNARCGYWSYHQICMHALATHAFDNELTVFFAIFVCLWGTLYLEFWKREQASLRFKWNLSSSDVEEEPDRPEYLMYIENSRYKNSAGKLPFWRRQVPVYFASFFIMLFLCLCAIGVIVGVVFYRISLLAALYLTDNPFIYHNAPFAVSVSAAFINLIAIYFLTAVYTKLATVLTDWECRRTQAEYDNSLTWKLYILQFVNFYSSLFYIAFFKGRFAGSPAKYQTFFGARQEECQGGCLTELCIQLAIIFVGKQFINNVMEIFLPRFKVWMSKKRARNDRVQSAKEMTPWERDFINEDIGHMGLFNEYLEMMIQFGFVTMFVAAFPLAPVFALLNNIIELRSDANKFVTQFRRPVAYRAKNIGVWYNVLYVVSRLAILMNAFIIAFTSRFIDRLVYKSIYSSTNSLEGFVNNSLSYFNVSDFPPGVAPNPDEITPQYNGTTICRYVDYRHPPWHDAKYTYTTQYWHIVAAQFIFVVCFENIVILLTGLIDYIIPDVPTKLFEHWRRETTLTNEIILKAEMNRARGNQTLMTNDQVTEIRNRLAAYEGGQLSTESESKL